MAGAGKKTFTAGETLTASDVNTYLMEQSVMYFGGTAARASAIPTPSTGMTTYIGVTGTATIPQLETYTGSAWQTPYGSTLLNTSTFTTAASLTVDNVFTSGYMDYEIVLDFVLSTDTDFYFILRAGGVDKASNYSTLLMFVDHSGGPFRYSSGTVSSFNLGTFGVNKNGCKLQVYSPQISSRTAIATQSFGNGSTMQRTTAGGGIQSETYQADGFKFVPASGTISGTIRTYGYRNS